MENTDIEKKPVIPVVPTSFIHLEGPVGLSPEQSRISQMKVVKNEPQETLASNSTKPESPVSFYRVHESTALGAGRGLYTMRFVASEKTLGEYKGDKVFRTTTKRYLDRFYVFKMGEPVSEAGKWQQDVEFLKNDTHIAWSQAYLSGLPFEIGVLGSNEFKFLNHSKNPNVFLKVEPDQEQISWDEVVRLKIFIIALRDISAGEELFFDYDPDAGDIDFSINPIKKPAVRAKDSVKRQVSTFFRRMREGALNVKEKERRNVKIPSKQNRSAKNRREVSVSEHYCPVKHKPAPGPFDTGVSRLCFSLVDR